MKKSFTFNSKIWLYPTMAGWHFAGVPKAESTVIRDSVKVKAGFGSIPVTVKIGKTLWDTSIFPDKKSGCYLLPIKVSVRKKEEIIAEDTVQLTIVLQVP